MLKLRTLASGVRILFTGVFDVNERVSVTYPLYVVQNPGQPCGFRHFNKKLQ